MPFGNRVSLLTEGDKSFAFFQYNDASGSLTLGMPVYIDVTDAAEFNALYAGTKLSPAAAQTNGKVVLGANANAVNLVFAGIFQPDDFNEAPAKGATIKVLIRGRGLVSAAAKTAGTAVLVGDLLITDSTQDSLLSGHDTYTVGKTVAVALATATAVASGASIIAVPGAGTTTEVINAYVFGAAA